MATGRLASGSIAAGGATQLYRNSTGNSQVITLLASSQVSGTAPKLNVKITNENFTDSVTTTAVTTGTNHTLTNNYPSQTAQLQGAADYTAASTLGEPVITTSGSQLHLSVGEKKTSLSMGQAWSKGYWGIGNDTSDTRDHPWGKVSFGGQPMGIGGPGGGSYNYNDSSNSGNRSHMPCYDPYYFENPNAFNQNKARGVVPGNDGGNIYHIEDISKMPATTLMKYYNFDTGAGADFYTHAAPSTDASTYGTVTNFDDWGNGGSRGWVYDLYTGLLFKWAANGYTSYGYIDEATPTRNTSPQRNYGDGSSNDGNFVWSHTAWNGSDPRSYDDAGHGSVYGCYADVANGLIACHSGQYGGYNRVSFKYYGKMFDNMMDKDGREINQNMETFSRDGYYHVVTYQGSATYMRLQWVAYHPGNAKWYVCFWDPSGSYAANPVPTRGTSYPDEAGIFEVDVTKIYGKDQTPGNTRYDNLATEITAGVFAKKGDVPDTTSGLMSKPMRIKDSLWTAHCQDGKMYFSTDLYTWTEQEYSGTNHFSTDYAMVNASKLGVNGTTETNYFVAANSKSVVYSYSATTTADVYDQAAVAGIIAKGAVTPYEQKAIILSDGDAIYVENEDATNAISVTAMGVDV